MKHQKPKIKRSEHAEQCAVIVWKLLNIGKYPELVNLFAIPNGGARDIVTGAKLKAEGVLAGVPDLFLAVPRGEYAGLFVEMKVEPNKPTEKQVEVMQNLQNQGYAVDVCYGADEAIGFISGYLKGVFQQDSAGFTARKVTAKKYK